MKESLRALEQAALPSGKEWAWWWRVRKRDVEMTYGWERALIDAVTRLIRNNLTLARQIRMEGEAKKVLKYDSEGHVYGESLMSSAEFTKEALVWFLQIIKPAERDAPEWAEILFKGVEGAFIQQARLGLELEGVKRKGYLTLNASATMPLPNEKDLHDKGMAAFGQFRPLDSEKI